MSRLVTDGGLGFLSFILQFQNSLGELETDRQLGSGEGLHQDIVRASLYSFR